MTSSVIANHLHIDVSASERDYGAPTFRGLRQKHLIDRETARCKSEGGCRHVQAPCPVDLFSGGGHGRYVLALEIPYPMPQGDRVVFAQGLHVSRLEPCTLGCRDHLGELR